MAEYRSKRLHQWRIAAVAPVPRHDWMVIVAADRREAYTPGRHLTITLGTHVGVAVVIVLACLALVALLLARTRRTLEARHSMAEALSMTDPLTGLGNRRSLGRRAEQLARSGQPAAAVLVDLDHFKQLNDTYGHAAGDRALQHVASAVRSVVRGDDEVVRLGGDELVVVMPGGDIAAAIATALRIRAGVEAIDDASFGTLSVSVGVAASDGPLVLGDLLDSADAHLYEDKRRRSSRLASQ
jgi:diguanylate cyclase (GGDEF)-like protein